jgi:3-hydroxyisobutyrate dehydrogenase
VSASVRPVGVVGLGLIGTGVVEALHRAQLDVVGYDIDRSRVDALAGRLRAAPDLTALAAETDVVLIAVMTGRQALDVLGGDGGILRAPVRPRVVVVLTTASIADVREAAAECERHGVAVLDCGVSGSPRALAKSSIVAMVGGDAEAFAIAEPVLRAFASPVLHMGPLGRGMAAKLARNLVIYSDWMVAWEGARLARAAGVDLDAFVEAVEASDRFVDPHMSLVQRRIGLETDDPGAEGVAAAIYEYGVKDLAAALELGEELGLDLPAARLAHGSFGAVTGVEAAATGRRETPV